MMNWHVSGRRAAVAVWTVVLVGSMRGIAPGQTQIVGTRTAALAGADIAEVYDVSGMYQNPATLVFLRRASFMFDHAQGGSGDPLTESIAFPLIYQQAPMLALGFEISHSGYLWESPSQFIRYGCEIGLGVPLASTVGIGALLNLRYLDTDQGALGVAFASLGALYFPSPQVSYGLTFNGLGSDIRTNHATFSNPITKIEEYVLPKSIEIGSSFRFPSSVSLQEPTLAISLASEKFLGENGETLFKGGIELRPVDPIAFRIGYERGGEGDGFKFGLGILFGSVRLDYAHSPNVPTRRVMHHVSLFVDF